MATFEHRIDISASTAVVWDLAIDVERWPQLFATVTTATRNDSGPFMTGSSARLKQPQQPERTWTVDELEPGRRFAWSTKASGYTMRAVHDISPTATGCTNRLTIELGGPLGGVIGLLAGGRIRSTLQTENEGFKRAAESTGS